MTDAQIVEMYWNRNEQAISVTAEKYGTYCYSVAYGVLHNEEDSEESVNDTYMSAWNSMPPHKPSVLKTFLGKITRRISIDRWRKKTAEKRGALAVIPAERDSLYAGVFARKVTNALPRAILAAIIYQNQFITKAFAAHRRIDSANQFGQRFVFVEQRNDDADVFLVFHDATVDRDYRNGGNRRMDPAQESFWIGYGTGSHRTGCNRTRYSRT